MSETSVFNWTTCQDEAISDITAWSYDKDSLTHTLSGAAGTGKSTVVEEILKHVKQKYGVCVSAPTHKAKLVISQKTGEQAETIQKLLGLRPDFDVENFDPNKLRFGRKNKPKIGDYSLIIVDEASMINSELFRLLVDQAIAYQTKVLFVGDALQLPPVGERHSLVFNPLAIDGISTLRTPARQKPSNPLTVLLLALRNDLDFCNENFEYLTNAIDTFELAKSNNLMEKISANPRATFQVIRKKFPQLMNGNEGYIFTPNSSAFRTSMLEAFKSPEFNDNIDFAKYIAYTNMSVADNCKFVRNHLVDTNEPLIVGDYLMSYASVMDWATKSNIITNSAEYKVSEINELVTADAIRAYEAVLDTIGSHERQVVRIVNPDDYDSFLKTQQKLYWDAMKQKGSNSKWRDYFTFKNQHLLIHDIAKQRNKKYYPHKDLDYGYGVTVHKSQGSTYNVSFVNGQNIAESYKIGLNRIKAKGNEPSDDDREFLRRQALSLMYVATSRSSQFSMVLM